MSSLPSKHTFKHFSPTSGYKVNWGESALMPLNTVSTISLWSRTSSTWECQSSLQLHCKTTPRDSWQRWRQIYESGKHFCHFTLAFLLLKWMFSHESTQWYLYHHLKTTGEKNPFLNVWVYLRELKTVNSPKPKRRRRTNPASRVSWRPVEEDMVLVHRSQDLIYSNISLQQSRNKFGDLRLAFV